MKQCNNRKSPQGFTLIELLIVIAVLGVLAVGVLTAINVAGTINKANLAKAKTFSASLENALSINQVGKWSFEDGTGATTFKDTSGYNNNGSCSGVSCPAWKTASDCGLGFGGCLEFDGVDDYIDAGVDASLPTSSVSFTASVWFTVKSSTDRQGLVARAQGPSGPFSWFLSVETSNKLRALLYNTVDNIYADVLDAGPTVNDGNWHHAAMVWDVDSSLTLYLDGVNISSDTSFIGTKSTDVPRLWIGWLDSSVKLNGTIDEVTIYNQALTAYQIQQFYAQGLLKHQLANK